MTITISNPTAPATDRQLDLVRHLAAQIYTPAEVEQVIRRFAATKGDASAAIERLLDAGATKPAQSRKAPTGNKATAKQVAWIMRLISQGAWHDSDAGQALDAPSRRDIERLTKREASRLIDDLR